MAGHLASAGHDVRVNNRSAPKAQQWADQHRGTVAPTPADAAAGADAVFVCVGNDDDVRQVVLGPDGALAALGPGTVIVDHTTASATLARELAAIAAESGVGFVDAPVSGGQAGAVNGTLTVMCGGDPAVFAGVAPLMAAYSRTCTLLGPSGSGQLTKMVNQIAIAGVLQGLAEALDFGCAPGSTWTPPSTSSARARPARGNSTTEDPRWCGTSSTSASPCSGCEKTSASASTKHSATAPNSRSRR